MNHWLPLFLTGLLTCNEPQHENRLSRALPAKITTDLPKAENNTPKIVEFFADSTQIGDKHRSKVEITKYELADEYTINVIFYKKKNHWLIKNNYTYECNSAINLDPVISDYNNDQLNDITFRSNAAARGSNEVRRLFIYNKNGQSLTAIVNSENYPNLQYNKRLKCIDAFALHGGTSNLFARIVGDILNEFARIETSDYRTVYTVDKNGREHILRTDSIPSGLGFERYMDYDPLIPYK